jgi:hypothetical protein
MSRKQWIGISGALVALALIVPSAALGAPGVKVIGEENALLATFKTAKCKMGKASKKGKSLYIDAISTNGGYELSAALILEFTGFHSYDLGLGPGSGPLLSFTKKGDSNDYSNAYVPPYPVPGFGQINFSSNGKRVGMGFGPAMWSKDLTTAVVVAGGLECKYAAKKKR